MACMAWRPPNAALQRAATGGSIAQAPTLCLGPEMGYSLAGHLRSRHTKDPWQVIGGGLPPRGPGSNPPLTATDEIRKSSVISYPEPVEGLVSTQVKTRPDDTRERIMDVADALFRRLGFAKTAVADIAGELDMSPANVYRFFPSKNAIVEAICRRCLSELDERAWAIARSRGPAAGRLERLVLEILRYHKDNLLTDKRVNDIVLVAIEDSWDAIQAHKDVIRSITEMIIRDGIESGEFERVDPAETARLLMRSLVAFMHPVLISQCLSDEENVEAEAHAMVRFVLRAITPRT